MVQTQPGICYLQGALHNISKETVLAFQIAVVWGRKGSGDMYDNDYPFNRINVILYAQDKAAGVLTRTLGRFIRCRTTKTLLSVPNKKT
jgi:hypothetical protein